MKIIYVAGIRIPTERAHGIHTMKMCEAFALSGNVVELVVPQRFNKIKKSPFEYYGVKENFKIKRLPCLDLIPLDKYIGRLGLYVMEISFLFFLFWYLFFKQADIFYTRDKLLLSLVLIKKNFIFEAHTFPKNYFWYALFLRKIKGMAVITKKLKDLFVDKGVEPQKILVAPDGVDVKMFNVQCSRFKAREKLGLPKDKNIVLYTGHLYPWKGVKTLAEASQYLSEDIEIYFVGGTEKDVSNLKSQISNLKLKNIMIVGHRPYSGIPYWLKAADVLVMPNSAHEEISKHWTSPLKMFEYMASQRPIVVSDLPSIREILSEENAVLVDSDSPQALARGIKEILGNPQLSDKISIRAFQDVQNYTWLKRAQKICQSLINI